MNYVGVRDLRADAYVIHFPSPCHVSSALGGLGLSVSASRHDLQQPSPDSSHVRHALNQDKPNSSSLTGSDTSSGHALDELPRGNWPSHSVPLFTQLKQRHILSKKEWNE